MAACRRVRSHALGGGKAGSEGEGAIRRAFRAALQRELSGLYQLLAHLDALAAHPPPPGEVQEVQSQGLGYGRVWYGRVL